jgi:hypothetical protein
MMKLADVVRYTKPLNKTGLYSAWIARIGELRSVQSSKDAATKALLADVKVALSGDYEPVIVWKQLLQVPAYYALCYRTITSGWCYCIRAVGENVNNGGWTSGFNDKQECIDYATRHLAEYER